MNVMVDISSPLRRCVYQIIISLHPHDSWISFSQSKMDGAESINKYCHWLFDNISLRKENSAWKE